MRRPDDVLSDIEVRTAGAPGALAQTVRETLARAEPRLPIVEVVPLERSPRPRRHPGSHGRAPDVDVRRRWRCCWPCLGLYGTISYGISRRVAELGLRMALGADRPMVLWMVLREALSWSWWGP